MRTAFAALTTLALATPVAGAPQLSLPIDCELGDDCYIQQYMDHDPSDRFRDFQCAERSYNTHKGTDFALPTSAIAKDGVNVLASAAGTVLGTRDGMPDVWSGQYDPDAIKGRDCGNGLVIDHGDGWQTQYCHLKNGSLAVQKGETVQKGAMLGKVGMSGRTQFPHVHLSVRKDGTPIDPFAPNGAECGAPITETLWDVDPLFQPGGFLDVGFSDVVPDFSDVKQGTANRKLMRISPALVSYVFLFGGKEGDVLEMAFTGPGAFSASERYELPKAKAQFFRAIGKKRKSAPWPGGTYQIHATLSRNGEIIDKTQSAFEIP